MPIKKKRTIVRKRVIKGRIKKDGTPGKPTWGGKRPNGGRPTIEEEMRKRDQSVQSFRNRYPLQPLDYAMCILNGLNSQDRTKKKKYSETDKKWAAQMAAPYLNQRLSALQVTGADNGPIQYSVDVRKLSDDELLHLEKIMSKASMPIDDENEDDKVDAETLD